MGSVLSAEEETLLDRALQTALDTRLLAVDRGVPESIGITRDGLRQSYEQRVAIDEASAGHNP